jgi:hypothetical protein
MAWNTVQYKLTSSAPLIMHNGQTADPLNHWAKALKQITAKKKKTDADHEEIARIEFRAGLYMDKDGPVLPANVIESLVFHAAMKFKEGPVAKSGCYCLANSRLEYDGPRDVDGLWADENFRFSAIVRVGGRMPRMRPIFQEWSAVITLSIEDTVVDVHRLDDWMHVAGTQIGLCDWRPQHGRFTAERLNGK